MHKNLKRNSDLFNVVLIAESVDLWLIHYLLQNLVYAFALQEDHWLIESIPSQFQAAGFLPP